MSNLTGELAAAKAAVTKMLKELDALQGRVQGNLEQASVLTRVTRLRTEVEVAKSDIDTRVAFAQASGGEPKVGGLLRTVKEKERELEELKAKYGL